MHETAATLEEMFPHWNQLTAKQQNELRQSAVLRRYRKGERIHQGQDDCNGLILVKSGQLRVFLFSESGKEVTLYRLFEWDICLFSASCVMQNISFDLYVDAEKDTQVTIIPAQLFDRLTKVSLPVAEDTNRLMASRFSDVMWVMEQILFTKFDSRLATFLLEQSKIEASDTLQITHEEIAKHLGSAREVVTKMLKYFTTEGAVQLSRGRITLTDKKKLNDLIQ